jgi:hypothetical protein
MTKKLTLTSLNMAPIMFAQHVLEDLLGKPVVIMQADIFQGNRDSVLQWDIKGRLYGGTDFHATMPMEASRYYKLEMGNGSFPLHIVLCHSGDGRPVFDAYVYDCCVHKHVGIIVRRERKVDVLYWLAYKPTAMSEARAYRAVHPIWPETFSNFYVDVEYIWEQDAHGSAMVGLMDLRGMNPHNPITLQVIPDGPAQPFKGIVYKIFSKLEDGFTWMDQS